ncbi:hypothetical protein CASFOL_026590 [Castilleja foliolosa]|uniref:Amino acid transporter transmembrane domain-containing protein n=1 Tax=Castilleja foliolosa TaxID=1961234 RepID=A0ABD3CHH7_9LAMI
MRRQDDLEIENPNEVDAQTITNNNLNSNGTTSLKTVFNGLNALSGVGILSIPYALSSGGGLSLVIFFFIAGCTFYTGLLIRRCMDMDPNISSYPDIGERAFGPKGRILVSIVIYVELFLVATGFLIIEGDNLHKLFPELKYKIAGHVLGGRGSFIFIATLVVLPTVWLDDMSSLSYISATGIIAFFILIGSVLWAGAFDGIGFHEKGKLFDYKGIPTRAEHRSVRSVLDIGRPPNRHRRFVGK